jgi:hypothetical protein
MVRVDGGGSVPRLAGWKGYKRVPVDPVSLLFYTPLFFCSTKKLHMQGYLLGCLGWNSFDLLKSSLSQTMCWSA